jgi:catechol 2,3-dioxygenase-like lactoylglutathione lyase family enzyme
MTNTTMSLGAFSVSLAVKDIETSRSFYQRLGFETVGGNAEQNWLILRNGTTTIGLFKGIFEKNMLTFNPGWDAQCQTLPEYTDVRELERRAKSAGLVLKTEVDPGGKGPGHFMLIDPDGNPILIDQHV